MPPASYGTVGGIDQSDELVVADEVVDLRQGGLRQTAPALPERQDVLDRFGWIATYGKQSTIAAWIAAQDFMMRVLETPERLRKAKILAAALASLLLLYIMSPHGDTTHTTPAKEALRANQTTSPLSLNEATDDTFAMRPHSTSEPPKASVVQSLRIVHLPCASGSCDNFLIERDAQGFLSRDSVCAYWSKRLGCATACKPPSVVWGDPLLNYWIAKVAASRAELAKNTSKAFISRFMLGRAIVCNPWPQHTNSLQAGGITYMVDHSMH